MLTLPERKTLAFIEQYHAEHGGVSPSMQEIASGIGQKSKGNVHRIINALVKSGSIRRIPDRARALEVVKTTPAEPKSLVAPKPMMDLTGAKYYRWDRELGGFVPWS